ncbi:MAG: hypothetical protein V1750_02090, partial [Acidobacteriota bacterium]
MVGCREGDNQARLGLEEGMLDPLSLEALGHDMRRGGQRCVHVATREAANIEHVAGLVKGRGAGLERREGIGYRRQHLVIDADGLRRRAGLVLALGNHHREHVADAAGELAGRHKDRPVANDRAHEALAGDIAGGEHAHHASQPEGRGRVDSEHSRPGMGGEH